MKQPCYRSALVQKVQVKHSLFFSAIVMLLTVNILYYKIRWLSVCLSVCFWQQHAKGSRERNSNFGSSFRKIMRCAVPKTNIIDPWESRRTTDNWRLLVWARRVTWSKFHTEDPKILGAIVQNLAARATWWPGFMHIRDNHLSRYDAVKVVGYLPRD